MSKNISEMKGRIAATKAKIKMIKEGQRLSSLSYLIESGMERAELVMAAKSITDKLQQMAETLAKIEASDVMPMMDSMKENFGPNVAAKFEQTVTQKLRDMTEALRVAKDDIGNEIVRMEASVNGEPVSDMDMPTDAAPGAQTDDALGGDDMGSDDAAAADPAAAGDQSPPAEGGDDAAPAPSKDELNNLFADASADQGDAPLGHVRKESVENGAKALRESNDPDRLVMRRFADLIRSGQPAGRARDMVAEHFSIDASDVVDIVRDYRR